MLLVTLTGSIKSLYSSGPDRIRYQAPLVLPWVSLSDSVGPQVSAFMFSVGNSQLSVCLETHIALINFVPFTEGVFWSHRGSTLICMCLQYVFISQFGRICMCMCIHPAAFCDKTTRHSYWSVMRNLLKGENKNTIKIEAVEEYSDLNGGLSASSVAFFSFVPIVLNGLFVLKRQYFL